jgi:hypothetical protein
MDGAADGKGGFSAEVGKGHMGAVVDADVMASKILRQDDLA